jgi:small-conductance mechanosensitive channel
MHYGELWRSALILAVGLGLFFGLKGRFETVAARTRIPRMAYKPLSLIVRYAILIVALIAVLQTFRFPVAPIFTGIAAVLGLVAIGFIAVWSILSNVLCTFVLITFKPFSIGDIIELPADNVSGEVVDLTLMFTTLRSPEDIYVQIPNNMFFQRVIKRTPGERVTSLEDRLSNQPPVM